MIDSCIILSAGLGTRMRPLTDNIPKPMVRVNQKPIISYIIDMVLDYGIEDIVVNLHYKPQPLMVYLDQYYPMVKISDETDQLLDSGGGVLKALNIINGERFFVINADCIWHDLDENPLLGLQNDHRKDMDIVKLLVPSSRAIGFSHDNIYTMDDNKNILKGWDYSYTGIQILSKNLFYEKKIGPFSIREIWGDAFEKKTIFGSVFQGQWLHIGTPQAVLEAEDFLKKNSS